jgi:hypothetical protein
LKTIAISFNFTATTERQQFAQLVTTEKAKMAAKREKLESEAIGSVISSLIAIDAAIGNVYLHPLSMHFRLSKATYRRLCFLLF